MATFLTVSDLLVFAPDIEQAKAQEMIDDATALASLVAPCIQAVGFSNGPAVKAILRWHEAGTGAFQQQTAGPFGVQVDTRQARRGMFWPSEITQLQSLCAAGTSYTVSLAGPDWVPPSGLAL